MTEIMRKQLT